MDWSCAENGVATLSCIPLLFATIVNWIILLVGVIAVFLIIYAGIRFILSGGDEKGVETARKTLLYAVIGLLIVLFSFLIINVIKTVTGAQITPFITFPTS